MSQDRDRPRLPVLWKNLGPVDRVAIRVPEWKQFPKKSKHSNFRRLHAPICRKPYELLERLQNFRWVYRNALTIGQSFRFCHGWASASSSEGRFSGVSFSSRSTLPSPKRSHSIWHRSVSNTRYIVSTPVTRITTDSVLAYIAERKKAGIANGTINRDLDVPRGVLKRAKRWHMMADEIRPLPVRHNVGRALAHDEKLRLLKVAASKPEWQNARLAAVLAFNTTMRAGEIRGLRWRDVDLMERVLTI
jgi:hypothetical protein